MSNNSRSTRNINRAKPVHGLEKIPVYILLKYSRQEVGELKGYKKVSQNSWVKEAQV